MLSASHISMIMDQMLDEVRAIDELKAEIDAGEKAWEAGDDPFEMAGCDPSDQYVKGEQIDEHRKTLMELADELDEALGRKKN